jgi:hypothetical protein
LNLRGPSNCKTGAIWPIFKGIRNAEVQPIKSKLKD